MKLARLAYLRACAILLVLLFSAAAARAQFSRLNDLAAQLEKELKPVKPHLVAVADFRPPYGADLPQGHYFAWLISDALRAHAKKHFAVAEHKSFDADLAKLHITDPLGSDAAHPSISPLIGADVLVTGSIERQGDSYILVVTPVVVATQKFLASLRHEIVVNEFLDSMVTPLPQNVAQAGTNGTGMPTCIHCPDPTYSDWARSEKISGVSIFSVLISPDGTAQQIRPLKMLGYGLDEQAYDAIKKWKFRPAHDGNGANVATIVPVEVTFRLY
jgi:TonB family protein